MTTSNRSDATGHFRMRVPVPSKAILAASVSLTALLMVLSFSGLAAADDCSSCHGTSGGYTFKHMTMAFKTTRVVSTDTEFQHIVEVSHPGKYKAKGVTVSVDLSTATGCKMVSAKSQSLGDMSGGSKTVIFVIKAGSSSMPQKIRTTLQYTATYHYTPTPYTEVGVVTLTLGKYLLQPSNWSVEVSKGSTYTLNLKANDAIRNLTLLDSPNLDSVASVSDITQSDMAKDNSLDLLITGKSDGAGILNVAYQDLNGTPYKISIDVKVSSSVETATGWGLWGIIGFWVGITSLLILIVSGVVGAPFKALKAKVNKVLRTARTRTAVHCGISYMLLALALMHGVVVMSHWWSGLIWNDTLILAQILDWRGYIVNLGVLSWVAMLLVAVGGAFYKPLVKTIKINKWRIFHTGLTLIALIAALVHGLVHLYLRLTGG